MNRMNEPPLVYLIAGEISGDLLGGALMASLKRKNPAIDFAGIGGQTMMAQGLKPLFPMSDLSVMGLVEVLAHLPKLMRRIDETVADILAKNPAVVVGIDAPDFCFRVEKKIRAADPSIKLVHYVAPSVWAWRPGRAKKIAKFLDHVLALLPFEPPYFEAVRLACTFVGHPAVNLPLPAGEAVSLSPVGLRETGDGLPTPAHESPFLMPHGITNSPSSSGRGNNILLLPGSRKSEVTRLLPLFLDCARALVKDHPDLFFVLPTVPHVAQLVREGLAGFNLPHAVVETKSEKEIAFATARAALAASGTVALELALAGVPAVISYRFSPLTGMIAHRVIRVKYASIPNLVFDREILPEFIQEKATADLIVPALAKLLTDSPERQAQISMSAELAERLKPGGTDPSVKAAEVVLSFLK
jgi:lipid-A-disaccharide synthase